MPKSITANLLDDIQSNVTTLATLVEIRTQDNSVYRITNHDEDIVFEAENYDHTIPFNLSAISSSSTLSVDNTELILHLDGTTFIKNDFINGAFTHAEVTVRLVDFSDLSHGSMLMRKGWIGEVIVNEQNLVNITISGLLKILDFEVGRKYQPSCDADLGDRRCKVAIDFDQVYSNINKYHVGEWAYVFTGHSNATLVNPGFEVGDTGLGAITGWTRSTPNNTMEVSNGSLGFGEASPPLPTPDPTHWLWGGKAFGGESSSGREQFMYNEVTVGSAGISTVDIDNDQIFIQALADGTQIIDEDTFKFQLEVLDANSNVLKSVETDFTEPTFSDDWETYALSLKLPAGTRFIRFYMWARLDSATRFNVGMDNYRLRWWNESTTTPWNNLVYKVSRVINFDSKNLRTPSNGSFDVENDVANTNVDGSITGWTFPTTNDYWRTVNTFTGLVDIHGPRFLMGGDDGSGTQSTYNLEQVVLLEDWGLNTTRIDLGKYMLRFQIYRGFGNTTSGWGFDLEFLDEFDVIQNVVSEALSTGAVGWTQITKDVAIPITARKIRIRLIAQSPVGSSDAQVAFDGLEFYPIDGDTPGENDPVYGEGAAATTFNTTIGGFTFDGNLVWQTHAAFVQTDVVAAVTDKKLFTGTNIAGSDGTFETAKIEWLSGNNAGRQNIIRTWNSSNKNIKLYFQEIDDIQVGDRFLYVTPCHKRFLEDCVLTFNNGINFRGFPYLPGKITKT